VYLLTFEIGIESNVSDPSPTLEEIELEEDTFGLEEFLADEPIPVETEANTDTEEVTSPVSNG
jgi:hypothetical protein